MLTLQMKDLLHQLRSGELSVADAIAFEQIPAKEFISDLREACPVLCQPMIDDHAASRW